MSRLIFNPKTVLVACASLLATAIGASMQLLLLALLFVLLLVGTDAGTRIAATTAQTLLPLEIGQLNGNLLAELQLQDVHYQSDDTRLQIQQLNWQLNLKALWQKAEQRQLHIRQLVLQGVDLQLPASAAEPEPTSASESAGFSYAKLPFAVAVDQIELRNVTLQQGQQRWTLEQFNTQLQLDRELNGQLALQLQNGPYDSQLKARLQLSAEPVSDSADHTATNTAAAQAPAQSQAVKISTALFIDDLSANWQTLPATAQGHVGLVWHSGDNAETSLLKITSDKLSANWGSINFTMQGSLDPQNPLLWSAQLPQLQQLHTDLSGSANLKGQLSSSDLSPESLKITLDASLESIAWQGQSQLQDGQIHWQGQLSDNSINAKLVTPLLNNSPLTASFTMGWRDSLESLIAASSQTPEQLLAQPALHFASRVSLPLQTVSNTATAGTSALLDSELSLQLKPQGKLVWQATTRSGGGKLHAEGHANILNSAESLYVLAAKIQSQQFRIDNFGGQSQALTVNGNADLQWNGKQAQLSAQQLQINIGTSQIKLDGRMAAGETLTLVGDIQKLSLLSPELSGQLQFNGQLHNQETGKLNASGSNIASLGQPLLSSISLIWQGSLAEQTLSSTLTTPQTGDLPINLDATFGWRDTLAALQQALSLPPEELLAAKPLHFSATARIDRADIAETGISLLDNKLSISPGANKAIKLNASSRSGDGQIDMTGQLQPATAAAPLSASAKLVGQNYRVANTPEMKMVVSPELEATLKDERLSLRGTLAIEKGHIELISSESGAIAPSSDVVIVDPDQTNSTPTRVLQRDINVTLLIKKPLTLEGQGFKGNAKGQVTVTESNGKAPRGRGELTLSGQYQAYGQDLTIRRGKLIYVDSPLDDPGVDLEAIRTVKDQIAGVRVTGLSSNPKISVFAEPALSDTEALSYLVLGRGLDDSSEKEKANLSSLALSLGLAKSGGVLKKYKDKIGVDELSIKTGSTNSTAALVVGRQLSERLYLTTEIGLFEPLAKLYLRYSLGSRCEFVAETGTSQGADLVCSIESKPK